MKIIKTVVPYVEGKRILDDYEFVGHAEYDIAAYERTWPYDRYSMENKIDNDIDDLYDGGYPICETDSGLCMVMTHWETHEPLCWCRVQRKA